MSSSQARQDVDVDLPLRWPYGLRGRVSDTGLWCGESVISAENVQFQKGTKLNLRKVPATLVLLLQVLHPPFGDSGLQSRDGGGLLKTTNLARIMRQKHRFLRIGRFFTC